MGMFSLAFGGCDEYHLCGCVRENEQSKVRTGVLRDVAILIESSFYLVDIVKAKSVFCEEVM